MKPNIIERAVELFKHTEPSYKAINMACEDLREWSPFVRLLVDAHCAHEYPYHCSYSAQFASNGGLSPDSDVDLEHDHETDTVMAMEADSGSGRSIPRSDTDHWSLPRGFVAMVNAKLRVLEQTGVRNMVLNKFDYRI